MFILISKGDQTLVLIISHNDDKRSHNNNNSNNNNKGTFRMHNYISNVGANLVVNNTHI
jgi:hypothetical protein